MSKRPVAGNGTAGDDAEHWRTISAQNLARFWEVISRGASQLRTVQGNEVWATDAASPSPFPNSATLQRAVPVDRAGALVEQLHTFYGAAAGGSWMLWDPWQMPVFSEHHLQLVGHPPLMVRPAGENLPRPPQELRIAEVADGAALGAFSATFINGFPAPELQPVGSQLFPAPGAVGGPVRFWVGSVAGEPVAVSAAYLGEQAVSVYMVATLPHARGKGYGAARTAHAVQAAPHLPAELQASDDGRPVYLRLGFQIVSAYSLWVGERVPRAS